MQAAQIYLSFLESRKLKQLLDIWSYYVVYICTDVSATYGVISVCAAPGLSKVQSSRARAAAVQ